MIKSSQKTSPIHLTEPIIKQYFETLNQANFSETAKLFTINGILKPPFEPPIEGQEAIASYLQQEAREMILLPLEEALETMEIGHTLAEIKGKVTTALFTVNVAWIFILNYQKEIVSVEVKLLASLEELVNLKR
ncbi:unknown [Crocosphaera subtropica ATCC 51142]|uniref:Nuclear transport factor 2 domain-containing protein n=1 Tax=Crocosphaera subtropica (strain ATCC 51142 / BH68) TaxID=43989 RepID=B1WR35_CROS5|nr:ketosteroid isomerase family protein [Crocosphaera subtropica]ACB50093.1 unknown [Crocosphaera subtropica ATCC 51142]